MLPYALLVLALSALLTHAQAQAGLPLTTCSVDSGNGVHVPGAVPANLYEPLQHRLAFAGSDGMTVSWSTFQKLDQPEVWCKSAIGHASSGRSSADRF
jgi:hypothetical protein